MANGTVGQQQGGINAILLTARDQLRAIDLEGDAMAAVGWQAMKPASQPADAAGAGGGAQGGQGKVAAGVLRRRMLAVDTDVGDAQIVILVGVARIDRAELG